MSETHMEPRVRARRKPSALWLWTVVLMILIVVTIAIGATKQKPELKLVARKATSVETITVATETYQETMVLPARVVADEVVTVSSETEGVLKKWHAEEGSHVNEGDLIAEMEKDTLLAQRQRLISTVKAQEASNGIAEAEYRLARMALESAELDKDSLGIELKGAQSSLKVAEREYTRTEALMKRDFVSENSYDKAELARVQASVTADKTRTALNRAEVNIRTARTNLELAQEKLSLGRAQLESNKAQLHELEIQLGKTDLRAPISGILDKHLVKAGELCDIGKPLVRLYKDDYMRAVVNVPDRYAPFLDTGNAALSEYVRLQAPGADQKVVARLVIPGLPRLTGGFREGLELPAEIARIAAATDEATNTFEVELKVRNPGGALRHGLLGQALITLLTYPEAVVIPVKAVQVSELGPRVLVAVAKDGEDVAEVRDIQPGGIKDGRLFITGGLQPGDRLIIAGQRGLVNGEPVRIIRMDGRFTTETPPPEPASDKNDAKDGGRPQ